MEIRRIQKTGGSSFTLSLPKTWVKKHNLQDKDTLCLSEQNGKNLLIFPQKYSQNRIIRVLIDIKLKSDNQIIREVISQYIAGADEIIIFGRNFNLDLKNKLKKIFFQLIGVEVVEESNDRMVAKNIFDVNKFSIPYNTGTIILMVRAMYKDLIHALEFNDKTMAKDIINRDDEIDRLRLAIKRQLYSLMKNYYYEEELKVSLFDCYYYTSVSTQLERIADHICKISKIIINNNIEFDKSFSKKFIVSMKRGELIFKQLDKMVRYFDKKIAHQLYDQIKNDNLDYQKIKYIGPNIIIEDSISRIFSYVKNTCETVLDQVYH